MNTLKEEAEESKEKSKKRTTRKPSVPKRSWAALLNGDLFLRENLIKNLPFIFYVTFLVVCYIGYGYYVDRTSGNIVELEEKSRELKADLNNESAYYNQLSMYSHIEDSTLLDNVGPSVAPAEKIKVSPTVFIVE